MLPLYRDAWTALKEKMRRVRKAMHDITGIAQLHKNKTQERYALITASYKLKEEYWTSVVKVQKNCPSPAPRLYIMGFHTHDRPMCKPRHTRQILSFFFFASREHAFFFFALLWKRQRVTKFSKSSRICSYSDKPHLIALPTSKQVEKALVQIIVLHI